jgi:hypothetical protein
MVYPTPQKRTPAPVEAAGTSHRGSHRHHTPQAAEPEPTPEPAPDDDDADLRPKPVHDWQPRGVSRDGHRHRHGSKSPRESEDFVHADDIPGVDGVATVGMVYDEIPDTVTAAISSFDGRHKRLTANATNLLGCTKRDFTSVRCGGCFDSAVSAVASTVCEWPSRSRPPIAAPATKRAPVLVASLARVPTLNRPPTPTPAAQPRSQLGSKAPTIQRPLSKWLHPNSR